MEPSVQVLNPSLPNLPYMLYVRAFKSQNYNDAQFLCSFQVAIGLRIEQLIIRGKYTMSTWLSRSAGDFNVTLQNVTVQGVASLEVNRQGHLEAQDIKMDIAFQVEPRNCSLACREPEIPGLSVAIRLRFDPNVLLNTLLTNLFVFLSVTVGWKRLSAAVV